MAGEHTGQKGYGLVGDASGDYPSAGVLGLTASAMVSAARANVVCTANPPKLGMALWPGKHTGQEGYGVVGDAAGQDTAGVSGVTVSGMVSGRGDTRCCRRCTADGVGARLANRVGTSAGVRGKSTPGPGVFGEGHYGGQFKGTGTQLLLRAGNERRPTYRWLPQNRRNIHEYGGDPVCVRGQWQSRLRR